MNWNAKSVIGMVFTGVSLPFLILGAAFLARGYDPLLSWVFLLSGLLFIGIGLYFLIPQLQRGSAARKAEQGGRTVKAVVSSVTMDPMVTVNGAHPWVVVAQYRDPVTSKIYSFNSDETLKKPEQIQPGMHVNVKVDSQDMSVYSFRLEDQKN